MIVTENLTINGKAFVKTCSDSGFMVERDGICYEEAIDPAEFERVYSESEERIEGWTGEANEADYKASLAEFGVKV